MNSQKYSDIHKCDERNSSMTPELKSISRNSLYSLLYFKDSTIIGG